MPVHPLPSPGRGVLAPHSPAQPARSPHHWGAGRGGSRAAHYGVGIVLKMLVDYDGQREKSMSLPFDPRPGTIVICDFRGFVEPEMVKPRPAVVISPKLRRRTRLGTIVPLSTSEPHKVEKYHHLITIEPPLPYPFDSPTCWVKGDMIYTVSYERLNLPHTRDSFGNRCYLQYEVSREDLEKIRTCIQFGLGIKS